MNGRPSPEAIARAGRALAEGRARDDALSPHDLAEAAYQPGGPSVEQLESEIRAMRGLPPLRNTA